MTKEQIIETMVEKLDLSLEEATALYEEDKKVDKMTDRQLKADLTEEQKKALKSACQVSKKVATPTEKKAKKPKASDDSKKTLIELIKNALENENGVAVLEVTNAERQIDFALNGRKFRIVLSAPRS